MEKLKINGLIVVEGKTDIDFLSSFIDASFYSVNGSAVNDEDLKFIKKIKEKTNVIVLTDPDYPGLKIRNYLNENIDDLFNAYVRKEVSIKKGKVGVAESTKEEITSSLSNLKLYKKDVKSNLELIDLYDLNLIGKESSENRSKLVNNLHIGYSNGKQLLKKLRMLGINKDELTEIIRNA